MNLNNSCMLVGIKIYSATNPVQFNILIICAFIIIIILKVEWVYEICAHECKKTRHNISIQINQYNSYKLSLNLQNKNTPNNSVIYVNSCVTSHSHYKN